MKPYRLGSFAQKISFPECPDAYFMIRPIGQEFLDRSEELTTEARVRLGLNPDDLLPPVEQERCAMHAYVGTTVMGWGGWETADGKAIESVPGALDASQFEAILMGDVYVRVWFHSRMNHFNEECQAKFKADLGKSAPQPSGKGAGAEALPN